MKRFSKIILKMSLCSVYFDAPKIFAKCLPLVKRILSHFKDSLVFIYTVIFFVNFDFFARNVLNNGKKGPIIRDALEIRAKDAHANAKQDF